MRELRFSTDGLPASQRAEAWRTVLSGIWGEVEIEPTGREPLAGSIHSRAMGGLVFNTVSYRGQNLIRTKRNLAAMADQFYALSRPLHGPWGISTARGEVLLAPGQLYLLSNAIPYRSHDRSGFDTENVMIPLGRLRQRLPRLAPTYQFALGGPGCRASLVADFAAQVSATLAGCTEAEADFLTERLIDLVAFLLARPEDDMEADDGSVRAAHSARIRRHIRQNLAGDLSPAAVAAGVGISVRYLHQVLRATGQSLGEHVLEARLEHCRRTLLDPRQSGRSLTDIAFAAGFNHPTHFSRAFRRRFGETPSALRRAGMRSGA